MLGLLQHVSNISYKNSPGVFVSVTNHCHHRSFAYGTSILYLNHFSENLWFYILNDRWNCFIYVWICTQWRKQCSKHTSCNTCSFRIFQLYFCYSMEQMKYITNVTCVLDKSFKNGPEVHFCDQPFPSISCCPKRKRVIWCISRRNNATKSVTALPSDPSLLNK